MIYWKLWWTIPTGEKKKSYLELSGACIFLTFCRAPAWNSKHFSQSMDFGECVLLPFFSFSSVRDLGNIVNLRSVTEICWKILMKIFCQTRHFEKISYFWGNSHLFWWNFKYRFYYFPLEKMLYHFLYDALSQNMFYFDFIFLLCLHSDNVWWYDKPFACSFSFKLQHIKLFSYNTNNNLM